jgi:hypothetical protein
VEHDIRSIGGLEVKRTVQVNIRSTSGQHQVNIRSNIRSKNSGHQVQELGHQVKIRVDKMGLSSKYVGSCQCSQPPSNEKMTDVLASTIGPPFFLSLPFPRTLTHSHNLCLPCTHRFTHSHIQTLTFTPSHITHVLICCSNEPYHIGR